MNPRQALLGAVLATVVFASAPACIRAVQMDAFSLGIVRLGLASLAMTIAMVARGQLTLADFRRWPARTWRTLMLVGLAFGSHWVLFFSSIKLASAAVGALGFSTYGIFLILLGWSLGFSQFSLLDLGGVILAFAGTLLLVPEFSLANQQTLGLVTGILSGLAAAFLPLLHQRHADIDVNLRTWGQFTFALVVFGLCWPWMEWDWRGRDVPLLLYLGLGIAWLGHGLWVRVTTALSTTAISILSYLYLPMALAFSCIALGEKLSGRMLVGAVMVLVANGLVIANQARNRALAA